MAVPSLKFFVVRRVAFGERRTACSRKCEEDQKTSFSGERCWRIFVTRCGVRKAPGFATTAVITLALGIGASTAIFTLVHQVMLKSLPVTQPDELWRIGDKVRCCNWAAIRRAAGRVTRGIFRCSRGRRTGPFARTRRSLRTGGFAARECGSRRPPEGSQAPVDTRNGEYVSGNFFKTFGIQPWLGRLITDEDDTEGAPLVAVMSYHIWQAKYGSEPSVVGATYRSTGIVSR